MSISDFGDVDIDEGPLKVTAMELWMGRNNGENYTLNLNAPEGDFADVRFIDRLLILIPIGALVLAWLAWMYVTGAVQPTIAAGSMAIVAFLLLAAPLTWEDLSTRNLEHGLDDALGLGYLMDGSLIAGMMENMYSTGEQALLGGIALVVSLIALAVEFASQKQRAPVRV
jgi:hypothetical protein